MNAAPAKEMEKHKMITLDTSTLYTGSSELESRIKALEDAHPEDLKDVAQHVTDIFVTLAKQRAVNEALTDWFTGHPDPCARRVLSALRDALK